MSPEALAELEEEQREEDTAWIEECRRRVPESADLEWDEFFHGVWQFLEVLDDPDAFFMADDMDQCKRHLDAADAQDAAGWLEDVRYADGAIFIEYLLSSSAGRPAAIGGRALSVG